MASEHPCAGLSAGRMSWGGSWAVASLEAPGCVLSLVGMWKCRHVGDLFSSHKSSTSPGSKAGSCFNTCRIS